MVNCLCCSGDIESKRALLSRVGVSASAQSLYGFATGTTIALDVDLLDDGSFTTPETPIMRRGPW